MTDWSKIHILIVEDSPTQMMVLCKNLQEKGVQTDVVKNGKEALTFLETKIPHIVISDVTMPEMNGFDLCKNIRNNPKPKIFRLSCIRHCTIRKKFSMRLQVEPIIS